MRKEEKNMVTNMEKLETKEYEKFLKSHYKGHYAQSISWAKIKSDWKNEIIIIRDENKKIKGTMSVLIRKLPYFKRTLMYAPRGPVCDSNDEETFRKIMEEADKLAKKYKAFMLKADPDVLSSNAEYKEIAQKNGFKISGPIKDITRIMQPRFVFRLNIKDKTEDEVFFSFQSKTRYNIRLATKRGVTIREGTREDLPEFQKIMEVTGERDDFYIRNQEYFENIWDSFEKDNIKLLFADYEGKPIACALNILYGDKEWYLYGGSLNEHRNVMPNYLIQWEMIKWAIENKCTTYDFRGICMQDMDHKNEGLYRFKKGFNADLLEFIEMYKVYNKIMYFIFEHCAYFYRDMRIKIRKIFKKN